MMNFNYKTAFSFCFICQIIMSSCIGKMVFKKMGIFDKTVTLKYITNGNKKIIFMPMHHIGEKEFYDDAKATTASFLKKNYMVFFEAVQKGGIKDSIQKDTIYRKIRKITGVDYYSMASTGGYLDTTTNTIMGLKLSFISKHKLINQSRSLLTSLDSNHVKNIDANILDLIDATEEKFGKIILEPYDFETAFGSKYKRKKDKEISNFFATEYRNNLVTDSILKSPYDKIMIVYGAKHFDGILENLKKADNNYQEVEKLE